jgi:putative transposase
MAGGPGLENWCLWALGSRREYHCGIFRESIETRRVPQVRFLNLGLGVDVFFVGLAMPAGLKRYYGKGHLHFITFSCYRRLPLLKTVHARDVFLKELGKVRDEMGFHLLGYVVMPEHAHLLISEPKQGTPSTALQKLKLRVARKLRKGNQPRDPGSNTQPGAPSVGVTRLPCGEMGEPLRAFWQPRFYDFNVYSRGKEVEKLNYMHANPVIRRLVRHPRDWAWSSWGYYYGEGGILAIDLEE